MGPETEWGSNRKLCQEGRHDQTVPSSQGGEEEVSKTYNMTVGARYRIVHRNEAQKHPRVSVVDYLGEERVAGQTSLILSQRPLAGTVKIPTAWIRDIVAVSKDTPIEINTVVRS